MTKLFGFFLCYSGIGYRYYRYCDTVFRFVFLLDSFSLLEHKPASISFVTCGCVCISVMCKLSTGFVRALEILENPRNFLKPWKSLEALEKPWNFFMKPWKISQNSIEKINSSNGAFSGLNNEHLEVTGHSGQ